MNLCNKNFKTKAEVLLDLWFICNRLGLGDMMPSPTSDNTIDEVLKVSQEQKIKFLNTTLTRTYDDRITEIT